MQDGSGGSGCIQDAVNDGGSGRSTHADGDERGSAQDGGRSAEEVGDGGGRVKLDGVGSRRHHGGEGIDRRGGGGDLVIAYAVAEVVKENSKFGEKYETTAKVLTPAAPAKVEQSTTAATTAKIPPMAPRIDNAASADRIGIRLPFHLPNPCEINHHHHRHQHGGMAGAPMLFVTPAAARCSS